ncbi:MAG TPA: IS200/IS605 family transposase [Thermoanaerobaculia bacterium]|jgi:REP element-mobilizing transposase RayT|nr:IS200/IS605 family transposase [Thermoanaerobaculia bacterium]
MRNTYSKLNYHIVFSTKNRIPLITETVRDELYGYIGGILRGNGGVLLVAGGMPDHVHLLAGWGTSISVAKMLQLIKANSSKWMNERPDVAAGRFGWQEGYGAFTVSESQIAIVRKYISSQEEHHRKLSFREEFIELLKRHGIPYDPDDFDPEKS